MDAKFVGILLRDLPGDFHVEFWQPMPLRVFLNQFTGSQKAVGSHLKCE